MCVDKHAVFWQTCLLLLLSWENLNHTCIWGISWRISRIHRPSVRSHESILCIISYIIYTVLFIIHERPKFTHSKCIIRPAYTPLRLYVHITNIHRPRTLVIFFPQNRFHPVKQLKFYIHIVDKTLSLLLKSNYTYLCKPHTTQTLFINLYALIFLVVFRWQTYKLLLKNYLHNVPNKSLGMYEGWSKNT